MDAKGENRCITSRYGKALQHDRVFVKIVDGLELRVDDDDAGGGNLMCININDIMEKARDVLICFSAYFQGTWLIG